MDFFVDTLSSKDTRSACRNQYLQEATPFFSFRPRRFSPLKPFEHLSAIYQVLVNCRLDFQPLRADVRTVPAVPVVYPTLPATRLLEPRLQVRGAGVYLIDGGYYVDN